jgi:hypothetical protein
MKFTAHEPDPKLFNSNDGIFIEELVEFSQLEENDFFAVPFLDFPILCNRWGELIPLFIRDFKGRWIIALFVDAATLGVFSVLESCKLRRRVLKVIVIESTEFVIVIRLVALISLSDKVQRV